MLAVALLYLVGASARAQGSTAERYTAALNAGYTAKARGDTAAARLSFEQAIATDTSQALPHLELGYLALAGGDRTRAADYLKHAVERDASRPEVHRQLGYVLISLQRTREAIAAFERATGRVLPRPAPPPPAAAAAAPAGKRPAGGDAARARGRRRP